MVPKALLIEKRMPRGMLNLSPAKTVHWQLIVLSGGRMELDFLEYTEDGSEKFKIEMVENNSETVPRRSKRQRRPPDFYGIRVNVSSEKPSEPVTIEEATACSDKAEWMKAMKTEMKSLKENEVWELVELPDGRKTVGSKWVYKVKTGAD